MTCRVPGAGAFGAKKVVDVEGTLPYYEDVALCVATDDEKNVTKREKIFEVDTDFFKPVTMSGWNGEVLRVKDKPVLVLFGAERCIHCKALHPVLEEALKEEFEGRYEVRYVDVDANQELKQMEQEGFFKIVRKEIRELDLGRLGGLV